MSVREFLAMLRESVQMQQERYEESLALAQQDGLFRSSKRTRELLAAQQVRVNKLEEYSQAQHQLFGKLSLYQHQQ